MSLKLDSLLKDKVVLYIVLFFAVTNFFGYVMMNNYDSIITMILGGLITSYFSKNMIVILLVSILSGSLVTGASSINEGVKHHVREGMTNNKTDNFKKGWGFSKSDSKHSDDSDDSKHSDDSSEASKADSLNKELKDNKASATHSKELDSAYTAGFNEGEHIQKETEDEHFTTRPKKSKKKSYKGASEKLDQKMAGLNETEAAMERLDKLLGGASVETLMKNQQGLTNAMKSIEPLMNKAESMLDTLTSNGVLSRIHGAVEKMENTK